MRRKRRHLERMFLNQYRSKAIISVKINIVNSIEVVFVVVTFKMNLRSSPTIVYVMDFGVSVCKRLKR